MVHEQKKNSGGLGNKGILFGKNDSDVTVIVTFSFLDHSAPKSEYSLSSCTYLKLEFPKASSKTSCLTSPKFILRLIGSSKHRPLLPSLPAIRVLLDVSFTPQIPHEQT